MLNLVMEALLLWLKCKTLIKSIKSLGTIVSLNRGTPELPHVNKLLVDPALGKGSLSHPKKDAVNELFSAELALKW